MNNTRFIIYVLAMTLAISITTAGQDTNGLPARSQATTQEAGTYDELKKSLMARYDQKTVVAEVSGLYAGIATEARTLVGPDLYGIIWSHFAANMQVPDRIGALNPTDSARVGQRRKTSDLHQLDDHTFGQLNEGKNLGVVQQGESLKVYKFYVYPDRIEFVLSPTGFGHLSNQATGTAVAADLGFLFNFYFNKGLIKDDHDYAAIVSEINKYLLPQDEAKDLATATAAAKQNVEIEPGMTEEQVIQKLGQRAQTVKFGDQKTLKYSGMTIVLKDGKVVDLKVE